MKKCARRARPAGNQQPPPPPAPGPPSRKAPNGGRQPAATTFEDAVGTCTAGVFGGGWLVVYILVTTWIRFGIESYLHQRQRKLLQKTIVLPGELRPYYSDQLFLKLKIRSLVTSFKYMNRQLYRSILTTFNFKFKLFCRAWAMSGVLHDYEYYRVVTFNSFLAFMQLAIIQLLESVAAIFLALRHQTTVFGSYSAKTVLDKVWLWMYAVVSSQMTLQWWSNTFLSLLITYLARNGPHYPVFCYLLYRVYRDFVQPNVIDECFAGYSILPEGPLQDEIRALTLTLNFPLANIYIDRGGDGTWHGARVRGVADRNFLVLSWRLVEGHVPMGPVNHVGPWQWARNDPRYTVSEVLAMSARAIVKWRVADTADEIILEASRWPRVMIFTMTTTFFKPFYSLFGFRTDKPPYVGFILSSYLAQPIIFVSMSLRHHIYQQRCYLYDEIIDRIGLGKPLLSFLCKESVANGRCPVEDPLFSIFYSAAPPLLDRIRRMENGPQTHS